MDREREDAERAERARRWGAWFARAMDEEGKNRRELVNAFNDGIIRDQTVSRWFNGESAPSVERISTIARFLNRNPLDVFRAAGYEAFAAEVEAIVAEAYGDTAEPPQREDARPEPTAADLLKEVQQVGGQVAEVMALLVEGLAAGKSLGEALSDLAHRQQAELDAVKGEAGVTDRALRGHIDDPRAHEYPDSDY